MIIGNIINQVFIDGQNLFLGTTRAKDPWRIDLYRFREYLYKRYAINKAFYFLGAFNKNNKSLYREIFEAGFNIIFQAHSSGLYSAKKGNVDTDIVFMMMRNFCEEKNSGKLYLVSGDGDYYKPVNYLLRKGKLGKVLFPSKKRASSLYKKLCNEYYDYLDKTEIRTKIEKSKKQLRLGS